ncbi:MAG TPA: sugar transferase, partial [Opitutus sp.]|nr:sugar transferase [Opitutus sp.]
MIPPTVPPFAWKRGIDIAFCLAALPLLVLLTLWLLIHMKLVAPGPLFFRQERIGRDGRPFICFKFRTMVVGEHSVIHQQHCEQLIRSRQPMTKMDARGDSRLMPGGWL